MASGTARRSSPSSAPRDRPLPRLPLLRRRCVAALLPAALPRLPGSRPGRSGAFIRIREPIPTRKALFDIGIAGPIAGFVVPCRRSFLGMTMSQRDGLAASRRRSCSIGEPLLFQRGALARVRHSSPTARSSTCIRWRSRRGSACSPRRSTCFPIGQLDGGHITYAVLGEGRRRTISLVTVAAAVILTCLSLSWLLMTVLMLVMLMVVRPAPPARDRRGRAARSGRRAGRRLSRS